MKRIVFIGYGDDKYVKFLNLFSLYLKDKNYNLSAVFFSLNVDKNKETKDSFNFNYIDIKCSSLVDSDLFKPEQFFNLFGADFYILWNGYHDAYATFRKYLRSNGVPHFLSEFSGIDGLFHFDFGLNGEASFLNTPCIEMAGSDVDKFLKLGDYINPNYSSCNKKLVLNTKRKIVTYFGLWDAAAGLSRFNSEQINKNQSPFFSSSLDACRALLECTPSEEVFFIVKPHPCDSEMNKEKFKEICGQNCHFAADDVDCFELIMLSDVIATINSSLFVLTSYLRKPLLLLGKTYLSKYSYPYKLVKREDISFQLSLALSRHGWDDRVKKIDYFFKDFICSNNVCTIDDGLLSLGSPGIDCLLSRIDELALDNDEYSDDAFYVQHVYKNIIYELQKSRDDIVDSRSWRYTKLLRWMMVKLLEFRHFL